MSMTPLHAALQAIGYTNCVTVGDDTAALHHADGGNVLRFGLRVDADGVRWRAERMYRGDAGVNEALAALMLWQLSQQAVEATGCN